MQRFLDDGTHDAEDNAPLPYYDLDSAPRAASDRESSPRRPRRDGVDDAALLYTSDDSKVSVLAVAVVGVVLACHYLDYL